MKQSKQSHFPVTAKSDPGMSGKNNEDRFAVSAFQLEGRKSTPVLLTVLSDGIGGHRAGEVASEIAVNSISEKIAQSNGKRPVADLESAVQDASKLIYRSAQSDPNRYGMGATCCCALIIGNQLYTATIGDSRIYLMRGNSIQQLSIDHTWIQEALEYGLIQPEEVKDHPNAHVIRRYLGSPTPPEVDFRMRLNGEKDNAEAAANQGTLLQTGDRILLCSDGLTDLVDDQEILTIFQDNPLDEVPQVLIDLANSRGGHDNITVIGIQVTGINSQRANTAIPWWQVIFGTLGLLAAVALIAFLVWGQARWLNRQPTSTPTFTASPAPTLINSDVELTPDIFPGEVTALPESTAAPLETSVSTLQSPVSATATPWPTNTLVSP